MKARRIKKRRVRRTCYLCGDVGIPSTVARQSTSKGSGICQYHWNVQAFGQKWADAVRGRLHLIRVPE